MSDLMLCIILSFTHVPNLLFAYYKQAMFFTLQKDLFARVSKNQWLIMFINFGIVFRPQLLQLQTSICTPDSSTSSASESPADNSNKSSKLPAFSYIQIHRNAKCEVWSAKCEVRSAKCEVRNAILIRMHKVRSCKAFVTSHTMLPRLIVKREFLLCNTLWRRMVAFSWSSVRLPAPWLAMT